MSVKWDEVFRPVLEAGSQERPGQTILGQAMLDTVLGQGVLIGDASTGIGKTFAGLVPAIYAHQHNHSRTIVSTETITLQNQLFDKDLPYLHNLYGGFKYAKLLGRSNYLCMNRLAVRSKEDPTLSLIYETLEGRKSQIFTGLLHEVEQVLGHPISSEEWSSMCGESEFCSSNRCESTECFCIRARAEAKEADIVVVNHALLASHQMSLQTSEEGLLGEYDFLIVDEAHALESVLLSQYSDKITVYELQKSLGSVGKGAMFAKDLLNQVREDYQHTEDIDRIASLYTRCLGYIQEFFEVYHGTDSWDNLSEPLSPKNVISSDITMERVMGDFEESLPSTLENISQSLIAYAQLYSLAMKHLDKVDGKGTARKIRAGANNIKKLWKWTNYLIQSMKTSNGIVQDKGAKGVNVYGYTNRSTGELKIRIELEPLDISLQARDVLSCPSVALISATIADPTDNGSFRYLTRSLGIQDRDIKTVTVDSPFDKKKNQLIYLSDDSYDPNPGLKFSHQEIIDLIKKSDGRALILFTSTKEMRDFHEKLVDEKRAGNFPYTILMQSPDVNKQVLAEHFKNDIHSVLLGSSSFMTGFDAPGETLSLVVMAKYTNPRLSTLTVQRMDYWKEWGFPNWYSRESLMTFFQAAGRLLRSKDCRGVVAVTDKRVNQHRTGVAKSMKLALESIGSPVTNDMEKVGRFYAQD